VLWNNPLIVDRNALFIGQTLRLPAKNGVLYNVHYGDTLNDIADSYKVEPTALLSLAANGLADAGSLKEGQTVLIVGGQPPAPPPPPPAVVTPSPTPPPQPSATPPTLAASATRAPAPAPPPAASSTWIWPAHGPISSYFGPGHPLGIDISQGAGGQPIIAARAGTVTFAGGDACCSYGYYVDINHGGGFSSRYGHFRSWPIVAVGQHVNQGQALGYAGSTGYSTGPHLHFEIHINGAIVNPLNYLPPGGN
jgi:murein DD-endopeptidase MepM/ murein hydrolase activator NlpD